MYFFYVSLRYKLLKLKYMLNLFKLFRFGKNKNEEKKVIGIEPVTTSIENRTPVFKRVYTFDDLPETDSAGHWNTIEVKDVRLMDKIYNHIISSSDICYYASQYAVECKVKTKKWGWVFLSFHYGCDFLEFGIYQSSTRYDIHYSSTLEKHPLLYEFISNFEKKAAKEYINDKNL